MPLFLLLGHLASLLTAVGHNLALPTPLHWPYLSSWLGGPCLALAFCSSTHFLPWAGWVGELNSFTRQTPSSMEGCDDKCLSQGSCGESTEVGRPGLRSLLCEQELLCYGTYGRGCLFKTCLCLVCKLIPPIHEDCLLFIPIRQTQASVRKAWGYHDDQAPCLPGPAQMSW